MPNLHKLLNFNKRWPAGSCPMVPRNIPGTSRKVNNKNDILLKFTVKTWLCHYTFLKESQFTINK